MARRRAGIKDIEEPKGPLTNVNSVDFIAKKYVKKKKEKTVTEIKRLQEKYENPVEKKGKPRSHIGNLNYKREKYGDFDTNKLEKMANNMNL